MSNNFACLCDDFYLDMFVNTELDLPYQRDTVSAFLERLQKTYPSMQSFYRSEKSEYCMEEDRSTGNYRWVTLDSDRIGSGAVNPASLTDIYSQDELILELIPYMLGVNNLDVHCLDVTIGMDFDCSCNHDEVIAEAFFSSGAFGSLFELPTAKPIGLSPTVVLALTEDNRTQARIVIESKTSGYEPGKQRQTEDEPITLSISIRAFPSPKEKFETISSFRHQRELLEELMSEKIIPNFVQPLTSVIAQKRLK
jgi:hypothetical protein